MPQLLPTTVIGSFPQPDWLVDRDMLRSRLPPRVLAREVWRVPEPWLEQAQDDATLLAIREMEQAGIDVITDGEIRRESYSNHFASSLAGVDVVRTDEPYLQSRIPEARAFAVPAIERALAGVSGTTALHTCFGYAHYIKDKPGHYAFLEELARCPANQLAIEAAQPSLDLSVLERLGDKTIVLGVIDLADPRVETAETVAERARAALRHLPPERLGPAPDRGMEYLPCGSSWGARGTAGSSRGTRPPYATRRRPVGRSRSRTNGSRRCSPRAPSAGPA